jgi:hypothetical protein
MSVHIDFGAPNRKGFNVKFDDERLEDFRPIPAKLSERDKMRLVSEWLDKEENKNDDSVATLAIKRYYDAYNSGDIYDQHPFVQQAMKKYFDSALVEKGVLNDGTGLMRFVSDDGGDAPPDDDEDGY